MTSRGQQLVLSGLAVGIGGDVSFWLYEVAVSQPKKCLVRDHHQIFVLRGDNQRAIKGGKSRRAAAPC